MYPKAVYQMGGAYEPGLLMFRPGIRRQHGMGLGSFFGKIWKYIVPFAKNVVLPKAVKAVSNVANDYLEGKNVKESLKSNALGVVKQVGTDLLNQTGSGRRRGKKRKASQSKRRKTGIKKIKRNKPAKRRKTKKKVLRKNNFVTLFD